MTRAELIQYITDNVYPNARNEVTAPMVRDSLLEIVDFLGDAATYNIGMVASGNQGLVTGGNVNTAIALALLPYYTAQETGQAIDDAIARIGLGQAAYKNIGQVAENNTDLVTGGQVYTAINTALTSAIKFQGISDTPLTDGSTTNPIQINGQSYTAKKGDMVVYGGNEFLWVGNKWQQMGDESSYALKTIQITGTGYLTGGGDLTQSRTLDISATAKGYIDHGEAAYNYFPGGVLDSTHLPSMYIGTTSVQFTAAAQNLTGISSVRATSNVLTLFEWDVTISAWHFHGNIYTDGWFSGGGISPGGGGGGGGIDPVAMWRLLTNDPSLTQYDDYTKISADHINFPVTSVVGLGGNVTAPQIAQALNLGSFAYKNSLLVSDIPDLSGTYLPLTAGQSHPLSDSLWFTGGTHRVGFRNNNDVYSGCVSWSEGNGMAYMEIVNTITERGIRLTNATTTAPVYWDGSVERIMYHAGNFTPSNYLEKTGGTMTGSLSCSTSGANISWGNITIYGGGTNGGVNSLFIGDDATIGDCNVDGVFGIKGQNSNNAGLRFFTYSGTAIGGIQSTNGTLQWYDTGGNYRDILHAGNFSSYALPIIAGGNNPLTNTLYIQTASDDKIVLNNTDNSPGEIYWNKICFSQDGTIYGILGTPGVSTTIAWYDGSYWNTIYHSGNANKDSVPWLCSTIGVGTSSPAYAADIIGDLCVNRTNHTANNTTFRVHCTDNYVDLVSTDVDDNYVNLRFYLGSNERFSIMNDGTINISNTIVSPLQSGNIIKTYYNEYIDCRLNIHLGASSGDFNVMNENSVPLLRVVRSNGYVGIGYGTTNPSYQLDVNGVIHASTGIFTDGWFSGGGVASSSDRRLKKNIKNFAYTPKLLLAIRPREWDWKDGSAMVGHAAGFVAQEIESIMPYAVDGTRNFKALFYDRFHALEIAGLQDHERRIVELERAVKERDEKIEKLEKMLKLN